MLRTIRERICVCGLAAGLLATATLAKEDYFPIRPRDHRADAQGSCEVRYEVPGDYAITGVALRASDGRITTLVVTSRRINPDGTLGESRTVRRGSEPDHYTEAEVTVLEGCVAVGFGVRIDSFWDVGVLSLWGARFHRDGTLGDPVERRDGFNPTAETEQQVLLREDRFLTGLGIGTRDHDAVELAAQSATASRYRIAAPSLQAGNLHLTDWRLEPYPWVDTVWFAPPGRVVTGAWMRAAHAGVATLVVRTHALRPDGTLADPRHDQAGWFAHQEPEGREAMLPEGCVATGAGLTIKPLADVQDFVLWGAKINPEGSLGEPCEVHGGFGPDVKGAPQQSIRLPEERVLVGLGFRIDNDACLAVLAASARIAVQD